MSDDAARPAPGEPVGRVNLPEELDAPLWFAEPGDITNSGISRVSPRDLRREKALYGLMAVAMMILAMLVILQGVFEQKMPV